MMDVEHKEYLTIEIKPSDNVKLVINENHFLISAEAKREGLILEEVVFRCERK